MNLTNLLLHTAGQSHGGFWSQVGDAALDGLTDGLWSIPVLFIAYLLICSDLPNTNWNWLFVPYNPLPLLLWRWRRFWTLPFAGLLAVWTLALTCAPHQLTDPAYLPLTLALSIIYAHLAHRSWKGVAR